MILPDIILSVLVLFIIICIIVIYLRKFIKQLRYKRCKNCIHLMNSCWCSAIGEPCLKASEMFCGFL